MRYNNNNDSINNNNNNDIDLFELTLHKKFVLFVKDTLLSMITGGCINRANG